MPKRVLNVGQCNPDHASICRFLTSHFDVDVDRADNLDATFAELEKQAYDLVLINRKLDIDYTEGMHILEAIKQHDSFGKTPVMIISNHANAQEAAVVQGAELGFGKAEYNQPAVVERLGQLLK